jgi:histone-lysine N-methyltransferase SETMAR
MGPQGISTAKKARTQNSLGKLMAALFWNMQGILLMKKGSTITREVYKETIKKLKTDRRKKRPHNCDLKIMLLYDNCRLHKARPVREVIDEWCFVEMEHPPYSPGLAPSDYYLLIISKLKKHLRGSRFSSDEYQKGTVKEFLIFLKA